MHQRCLLVLLLQLAACDETISGQQPVGGNVDTDAEIQRYLRRTYLDLSGNPPAEETLTAATARLRDAGNTPTARAALIDELIATNTFSTVWIEELEDDIFGGNSLDNHYRAICGITRSNNPVCQTCTDPDPCLCTCPQIAPLKTERDELATSPADMHGGMKTSTLERRYAMKNGYAALANGPEGRMRTLFEDFLERTAEPDEIENGRMMIFGSIFPGSPAGLLFHRHGSNYADMLDIIFDSEVYREAMVRRAFNRYIARQPTSAELAHFVATIDATEPDMRPLVRAVVSSREYFDQ